MCKVRGCSPCPPTHCRSPYDALCSCLHACGGRVCCCCSCLPTVDRRMLLIPSARPTPQGRGPHQVVHKRVLSHTGRPDLYVPWHPSCSVALVWHQSPCTVWHACDLHKPMLLVSSTQMRWHRESFPHINFPAYYPVAQVPEPPFAHLPH